MRESIFWIVPMNGIKAATLGLFWGLSLFCCFVLGFHLGKERNTYTSTLPVAPPSLSTAPLDYSEMRNDPANFAETSTEKDIEEEMELRNLSMATTEPKISNELEKNTKRKSKVKRKKEPKIK